jgi:hypothetical protein
MQSSTYLSFQRTGHSQRTLTSFALTLTICAFCAIVIMYFIVVCIFKSSHILLLFYTFSINLNVPLYLSFLLFILSFLCALFLSETIQILTKEPSLVFLLCESINANNLISFYSENMLSHFYFIKLVSKL